MNGTILKKLITPGNIGKTSVNFFELSVSAVKTFAARFHILFFFSILTIQFSTNNSQGQPIGNGKNGSPEISGIINVYTQAASDIFICQEKIPVKNTSGFSAGDLVLIVQMQGAEIDNTNTAQYGTVTGYANAGNYEFALVDSIGSGNIIFLKNPLLRNFSASGKTQVILVPQYADPTISGTLTCREWDGETGGILAFDATGTVSFNSTINVNGKGFRGGKKMSGAHFFSFSHDFVAESYDPDRYSLKGEGIAFDGIFPYTSGRGAPANGGGGGNIHTAGGGGGSNSGCGGKGGWGYPVDTLDNEYDSQGIGGYPLPYSPSANKIFMGGGGGAGHEHFDNGTDGEDGAGLIIITANQIKGNSKMIMANGNNSAGSGAYGDGTGGAGAGGTILLSVNNFSDTIFISAKGGDGGSSILKGFGPGGGGGGGTLLLSPASVPPGIVISSLAGGAGGIAGGNFYGAEAGCAGAVVNNFKISFNNYYEGVKADFTFDPSYLSAENNSVSFANLSSGATSYQWSFGDENSDYTANPTHAYNELKDYTIMLVARDSICSDTAAAQIAGEFIPNVFTPDGDGINDFFYFSSLEPVSEAEMTIFNRWGELVFSKNAKGKSDELRWDGALQGKPVPEGVYYFVINYSTAAGEKKSQSGYLTLIR